MIIRSIQTILFILLIGGIAFSQEICDNGIDDDSDGLIDLNDEECICNKTIPTSLIPNPSFEERTCCPTENAMLDCADGWIQASRPTTDYIHTCGDYLGNTSIPAYAPLPLADGEGAVGFRDGQRHAGINYKEYVGACLTEAMEAGVDYTFDFFVGFRNNIFGSEEFTIAVFGSTDCNDLPFGGDDITIGCPRNTGNYDLIGEKRVSGSNEWVNVSFDFVANKNYETIILGPSCTGNPNYIYDPYFYVDRLTLAKTNEFGIPFTRNEGSICDNNLILGIDEEPDLSYQWYRDGIALVGETASTILLQALEDPEGKYQLIIFEDGGCFTSQEYNLRIPPYYATDTVSICDNESYMFGDIVISEEGNYERLTVATDGCDSIIQLFLDVRQVSYNEFQDYYCEGEEYPYLKSDIFTSYEIYATVSTNFGICPTYFALL